MKLPGLPNIDVEQAMRFGVVGASLHGPWFYSGFRFIDTVLGSSKSLGTAVAKTATGQFLVFPPYLAGFFYMMGALEGLDHRGRIDKMRGGFGAAYAAGCVFWPCANMINFSLIPSQHRILYVNVVGLAWNVALSYITARTSAAADPPASRPRPPDKSGAVNS